MEQEIANTSAGTMVVGALIVLGFIYFVVNGIKKNGRAKKRLEEGQAKIDKLRGK